MPTAKKRRMREMNPSKLHNCKKSKGKIIGISVDDLGVTRCGYCNEVVDYAQPDCIHTGGE